MRRYTHRLYPCPQLNQQGLEKSEHPESTVVIEGHTDSVGSDQYNEVLSENRANAVVSTLIDLFGIDKERVSGVGYGEARPIASNETAMGRQQNRRVMAEIYGEETTQIKRWNIYSVDNMDMAHVENIF